MPASSKCSQEQLSRLLPAGCGHRWTSATNATRSVWSLWHPKAPWCGHL